MTSSESSMSRWRVTANGHTSAATSGPKVLWEKGEMANANLWAETLAPGIEFTVERYGVQRPENELVASVTMTVRVNAVDASEAERTVRVLFEQAMPRVTFSQILAEQITGRHVSGVHPEPMCSFCGQTQRQVKKLIAGPGVYICDDCVGLAVEIIARGEVGSPAWYRERLVGRCWRWSPVGRGGLQDLWVRRERGRCGR